MTRPRPATIAFALALPLYLAVTIGFVVAIVGGVR